MATPRTMSGAPHWREVRELEAHIGSIAFVLDDCLYVSPALFDMIEQREPKPCVYEVVGSDSYLRPACQPMATARRRQSWHYCPYCGGEFSVKTPVYKCPHCGGDLKLAKE